MKNKNKMTLNHKNTQRQEPKKTKLFRGFFTRCVISLILFCSLFFGSRYSAPFKENVNSLLTKSTDINVLKEYAQSFFEECKKVDIASFLEKVSTEYEK